MIIASVVLFAILLFLSMTMIDRGNLRIILALIFGALTVVSMMFMTFNDANHYGMHKVTKTETSDLISVSPSKQMKMLLYQNVGTSGKEKVYVYKTHQSQKKASTTNPDPKKASNRVKTVSGTPTLVTKTTRWEFNSKASKVWFNASGYGHKLVKRENTFNINKDWMVLSSTQAKKLQKLVKANQAKMKTEAKAYVTAQVKKSVTAAMTKNPTMSSTEQARITKQATAKATADYQKQAMAKIIAQVK